MPDIDLLRTQKNRVLQSIKDMDLDPFNFEWTDELSKFTSPRAGTTVPCLKYKGTEYFFLFDMNQDQHYCFYSPGAEKTIDQKFPGCWDGQLDLVWQWLRTLKREIEEPDDWEQLAQFRLDDVMSADPDTENLPFTINEAQQITDGINRMRTYLESEFDINEDDHILINQKLDYLIDSAKRQGRQDWLHTCIGVLTSLGSALCLSPEHGSKLLHILKEAVSGVIKLLQ